MKAEKTGPYIFSELRAKGGVTSADDQGVCLPALECCACGNRSVDIELAMPSIKIPASVNRKLLSRMTTVGNEEFKNIELEFAKINPGALKFIPGAQVGPVKLRISGKCRDALSAGITLFFSARVVKRLQSAGVRVRPIEVKVFKRNIPVEGYYCCEPTMVELASLQHLRRHLIYCPKCLKWHWNRKDLYRPGAQEETEVYVKKHWPRDEGTIYDTLTDRVFYSDAFVEACSADEFIGLGFKRIGRWI